MTPRLDRLADRYGIELSYVSETGEHRTISDEVKRALLSAMGVADIEERGADACFVPEWLRGGRCWGVSVQLYGLRSQRNQGIGDFDDLVAVAQMLAARGADFVGVNPLHALFWREPERCSPYSPSSRMFLNPLYIAVDRLIDADLAGADARRLRETEFVDYAGVASCKRRLLQQAYDARPRGDEGFQRFIDEQGEALWRFAVFEALSDASTVPGSGWSGWSSELKDASLPAAQQFAAEHGDEIRFHQWLQWIASDQLRSAQRRALDAGMRIGLYLDLAISVAPDGAATWSDPKLVAARARVGAPPDAFHHAGQDWGLAPMVPAELSARSLEPFRRDVAAQMRAAGAIRIDHAMGLKRLYWIPEHHDARSGGYVRYPFDALLESLAQISQELRCIVIGEDLGTVPAGFRDIMRGREVHGYRVLFFERLGDGHFVAPEGYPREVMCCLSTHDLPTLAGWWSEADIEARSGLGAYPAGGEEAARGERERARLLLLAALVDEGLVGDDLGEAARSGGPVSLELPYEVAVGTHVFLARTPCRLLVLQLEDLVGETAQVNLPGTYKEYPNWRQKLAVSVEDMAEHPLLTAIVDGVSRERPKA